MEQPTMSAALVAAFVKDIARIPRGTVIAINSETGDYTTGASAEEALRAFEARYGWGVAAYVHVVS
jgi:hypothetical protein